MIIPSYRLVEENEFTRQRIVAELNDGFRDLCMTRPVSATDDGESVARHGGGLISRRHMEVKGQVVAHVCSGQSPLGGLETNAVIATRLNGGDRNVGEGDGKVARLSRILERAEDQVATGDRSARQQIRKGRLRLDRCARNEQCPRQQGSGTVPKG